MAENTLQSFKIDNSLSFATDGFDAQFASSSRFLNAADGETINLSAGFYDENNNAQSVVKISGGLVDEWTLNVTPTGVTSVLTGRDQGANIVDKILRYRFIYQKDITKIVPPN